MKTYYERRPSVQAIRWTGDNTDEVVQFARESVEALRNNLSFVMRPDDHDHRRILLVISPVGYLAEGEIRLPSGDYLVKDQRGLLSLWDKQAFEERFE